MDACVDLQSLRFRWPGEGNDCLAIAALQVKAGERVFLHGPSGSGKSTLLSLLGGVLLPTSGRIALLGQDWASLSASQRDGFRADHLGIIFQQFNLIPYLSVLENVLLPCRFSAWRAGQCDAHGAGAEAMAKRLLDHLEIAPTLQQRRASDLSVGQQQRVAAARALIGRPALVIADEPTSALDVDRQVAFLALLNQECAASGASLLFVSHDARLACQFDRQIALASINQAGPAAPGGRAQ